MGAYADRDALLKRMGFSSYALYLASDLWASIRSKVMLRDRRKCRCCRDKAIAVHHHSYDEPTMRGQKLDDLFAICEPCHRKIEKDASGEKYTFARVRQNLVAMLNAKPKTKAAKPAAPKRAKPISGSKARKKAKAKIQAEATEPFWIETAKKYHEITKRERKAFRRTLSQRENAILESALSIVSQHRSDEMKALRKKINASGQHFAVALKFHKRAQYEEARKIQQRSLTERLTRNHRAEHPEDYLPTFEERVKARIAIRNAGVKNLTELLALQERQRHEHQATA